jgi:hypothetical protein
MRLGGRIPVPPVSPPGEPATSNVYGETAQQIMNGVGTGVRSLSADSSLSFGRTISGAATTDAMRVCDTPSNDQFPYIRAAFVAVGTAMNGVIK